MRWEFEETQNVRTRLFLKTVCQAAPLHARLLNTLSLLEHIGSRKIMGKFSASRALMIFGWAATALMAVVVAAMLTTSITG